MTYFITLVFISLLAPFALADTYFIYETKGKGIGSDDKETITELIKSAVQEQDQQITELSGTADYSLKPRLLKLGESFILKIRKYKGKKAIYSGKLKASSLEDMDTVVTRLVRAAINEESAKKNARVDDVTKNEVEKTNRRKKALKQWYFGFGPGKSSNLNTSESALSFTFGYNWGIDEKFDLNLSYEFFVHKDSDTARFSSFDIGINYFLTANDSSIFFTGLVGYGSAQAHDPNGTIFTSDDASDFVLGGGAGFKFFRTSNVNVGLLASFKWMASSTSKGNPTIYSLRLGIYY